ncbi:P-loop NTPase fold protein [Psychrobacter sp. P11G3]|uniref:KAP family P-loop NTPase fold protein n=1 Tax=Psychrobacter sp. P11G3 TaxID=1699623 RepID=UPI00070D0DF2|nr:P-loop NTPase fold protein [Psychrobacter sp. P11G3]KRG36105.1 KAP family P-loop domain protein [Psychrobacter sp. P11G3]
MWSDVESSEDYLNFGEVSDLAVDILSAKNMLPISIGIFGNWGAGKSSLLKLIETKLEDDEQDYIVINFDAWLYQGFDDARAALLEVIATRLLEEAEGDKDLVEKGKGLLKRVNIFRVLGLAAEGAALFAGVPTAGLLARGVNAISNATDGVQDEDEYTEGRAVVADVKNEFDKTIKPKEAKTPPQQIHAFRTEYEEILDALNKPVVIIIDNLDRCLPANAIHTLEAIRLFLFLKNTAFIIAADEEMIKSSVAEHFKGSSDRHQLDYIDKLIQVPIRVPKAGMREIRSYLFMLYAIEAGIDSTELSNLRQGLEAALQQSWKDDPITRNDALALLGFTEDNELAKSFERADRIAPILANSPIIHGNPRTVKRLLNVIKMRVKTAQRRDMPINEAIITKLVIFERCAGAAATKEFYSAIDKEKGKPNFLKALEDKNESVSLPESLNQRRDFINEWCLLEPKLSEIDLRPAIYLSRETIPLGSYVTGLSPIGRVALESLSKTKKVSSPAAKKSLEELVIEEQVPVMEGLISHLRNVSDWNAQPEGFAGAFILAEYSSEAAKVFVRYLNGLNENPPWMNMMLKSQSWYKE